MKSENQENDSTPPQDLSRLQKPIAHDYRNLSVGPDGAVYFTVLSSLVGAVLLFVIGVANTVKAVMAFIRH